MSYLAAFTDRLQTAKGAFVQNLLQTEVKNECVGFFVVEYETKLFGPLENEFENRCVVFPYTKPGT